MSIFTRVASYIWRLYETDGTPSSGKHEPKKEEIILWGTEMETLLADAPNRIGAQYRFSDETDTEVDPGSGKISFNLGSPSPEGVTEIAISDYDIYGLPYANFWQALGSSTTLSNRGTLMVREAAGDVLAIFRVDGAPIAEVGWTRLPVDWMEGSGAFADNDALGLLGLPTGDEGGTKLAIPIFDPAAPVSGEVMWAAPMPAAVTFLAGLSESRGTCEALAGATAVFSFRKAAAGVAPSAAVEFATAT